ncbi:MAG: BrnT family toxin [Gemmatimonadota bacterium]|nr:BrnT family toxin [Gemmatimonadota bacterium]
MAATFEWDPAKAARNYATHGVTFDEASTVFRDPLGRIVDDPRHSRGEDRFVIIGSSKRSRLIAVMFTERRERIRLISARLVTRAERRNYEERTR